MAEAIAKYQNARMSAQKVRLVADQIRRLPIAQALEVLKFSDKKAAKIVKKVLESAIANAEHNAGADIDELNVAEIFVNTGPKYKRMSARAKGRGDRIEKPTCHVQVKVSDVKAVKVDKFAKSAKKQVRNTKQESARGKK